MVERIVSGGQTGADRAALDWAIRNGIAHGGWCPSGRLAEDGPISGDYRLRETDESRYQVRTERNVIDSDGTVVFTVDSEVTGGSLATIRFAKKHRKPCIHLSRATTEDPAAALRDFIACHDIAVLNVAGPRASGEPEIGDFVADVLEASLAGARLENS